MCIERTSMEGGVLNVKFSGTLGFGDVCSFRKACESIESSGIIFLDFKNVTSIESSILGLLLVLEERNGKSDIKIINYTGDIKMLFQLVGMQRFLD